MARISTKDAPSNQSIYNRIVELPATLAGKVIEIQSPFLYIRLVLWLFTITVSFLPFIGVETNLFSNFNISFTQFYRSNYEGILEIFVVTIAVSMFDVLAVAILLVSHNSYIAVSAVVIFCVLAVLLIIVGLALGASILSHRLGTLIIAHPPEPMHYGFLSVAAALCMVATGFVAVLSNEYKPKKANSKKGVR